MGTGSLSHYSSDRRREGKVKKKRGGMHMPDPVNPKATTDSTYVLDAESELELSRLLLQDRLLTKAMGGVWPEQSDVTSIRYVLDLACGPGGWVLDIAAAYPEKDV